MTKFTVTTPVKGFSGLRAGVMFHLGKGEVDDADPKGAKALAYFQRKGYAVSSEGEAAEAVEDEVARPSQSSSKADWAVWVGTAYSDEVDPEQAAGMTKSQLMDYVREREGEPQGEPEGDEE